MSHNVTRSLRTNLPGSESKTVSSRKVKSEHPPPAAHLCSLQSLFLLPVLSSTFVPYHCNLNIFGFFSNEKVGKFFLKPIKTHTRTHSLPVTFENAIKSTIYLFTLFKSFFLIFFFVWSIE